VKIYHVYMLLCADGSFYIGITSNLDARLGQHAFGVDPNCYTYERRPVRLLYAADFPYVTDAIAWEKHLKGWSRAKKRALIAGDWERMHTLARCSNATGGRPSRLRRSVRDDNAGYS
jgi:putative endonuclease